MVYQDGFPLILQIPYRMDGLILFIPSVWMKSLGFRLAD